MGSLTKIKYLEKRFKEIGKVIKTSLKNGKFLSKSIFKELDREFEKIREFYINKQDLINLLHIEHNYKLYKSIELLQSEDVNGSFSMLIEALLKLIERHELRKYPQCSLNKMLGMYKWILNLIEVKRNCLNLKKAQNNWMKLIKKAKILKVTEILELCIQVLLNTLLKNYEELIEKLRISSTDKYNFAKKLESDLDSILITLKSVKTPLGFLAMSVGYEILYKLNKKCLHYLVNSLFFEKLKSERAKIQEEINKITKKMLKFSKLSYKKYEKYIKIRNKRDKNIILAISLKELDRLAAEYYFYAYSRKDIFAAWQKLDAIKQYIVRKVFKEKIPLSQKLKTYFGEEWTVLYIFAKLYLLKEEVKKKSRLLTQEWEKEIFLQIYQTLESLENLFKYEVKHSKDYTLKIMTIQFSGGFSEYFIYELFREFFENGVIDEKTPNDFKELLECIKTAKKDSIILNDFIEKDKPDIDIHIRGKCAVFLKNAKIDNNAVKQIWEEIKLCRKKNIKKIFYGINFIKNLENIEYVRKTFSKIIETFREIKIQVFDIKDLVSTLISELKRSGKSKFNFSEKDLYKVLDY